MQNRVNIIGLYTQFLNAGEIFQSLPLFILKKSKCGNNATFFQKYVTLSLSS